MRRTVLPLVLLIAALGLGAFAVVSGLTDDDVASGTTAPASKTPLLSPRRVPTWLAAPVGDQRLVTALDTVQQQSPTDTCMVAAVDDRVVYQRNETLPVSPASNMKLVTAAAAVDVLGQDFRYRTNVVGPKPDANGTVQGDLVVVGSGDPSLATKPYIDHFTTSSKIHTSLESLADAIVKAGVKQVTGRVVGDDSRYDAQRYPEAWPAALVAQNQSGPISALSVNDGYTSWPAVEGPGQDRQGVTTDPAGHAAAEMLADQLRARGVTVGGSGAGRAPAGAAVVASIDSPPMSELVHQLVSGSDDETAEALLKEMAVHAKRPGTTGDGLAVLRSQVEKMGLPTKGLVFVDGSGLSADDRVTCQFLVGLLNRSGPDGTVGRSLSVSGTEGTLVDRFGDPSLKGKIQAKTGSLNRVTALSGFADTAGGTKVTFAYVANGRTYSDALVAIQDGLVAGLVRYPEGVPVDQLSPS